MNGLSSESEHTGLALLNDIRETRLDNGLKVLCLPKRGAPVASVQVWYKTGSANETAGERGVSHFVEHLMFRGSINVPPEMHARRINEIGGQANACTSEDFTTYTNSVPSAQLDLALELEAERMCNLKIVPEILETERRVIIEEYHTYMNNPVARAFLEFRREFFGGHPYAEAALGALEDLQALTLEQCQTYYRQWYRPSNALLVIVGDIGETDDVFERVVSTFGGVDAGGSVSAAVEAPGSAHAQPRRFMRRVDFDVPMVLHGYRIPPLSHPDGIALSVLQQALSHGEASRMVQALVKRQGVAVLAGGANVFMRLTGMSLFFAAFTPDMSSRRVEQALQQEVARVRDQGLCDEELEKVRNALLTSRTFDMYSAQALCHHLGYSETVEGTHRAWLERLERLTHLTHEQIIEAARKHWDDAGRWTLRLRPRRTRPLLFLLGLARRLFHRS